MYPCTGILKVERHVARTAPGIHLGARCHGCNEGTLLTVLTLCKVLLNAPVFIPARKIRYQIVDGSYLQYLESLSLLRADPVQFGYT